MSLICNFAIAFISVSGSLTAMQGEEYECIGSEMRLDATAVCDGIIACPLGDDEAYCGMCIFHSSIQTNSMQNVCSA